MTQQIVYAIHNFEAENEDEINFSAGEPIVVLERDDKYMDGWWQGRNVHGHVGLFPMNYVSPEKPQRITKASTTASSSYYSPSPSSTTSLNKTSHSEYSTLEEKINNAISHVQSATSISARPEDWDTSMVASWLESAGLGSVGHIFVEQEISGDILLNLTMDSLKELGISTFGKRYKIMQAIGDLKAERREEPKSRAHGGSRHFSTATPPSPVESDKSYHTPRYNNHASSTDISVDDGNQYFLAPTARNQHPSAESMRPISPQSLSSPNVSRSNTLNTMSSRKSSSSTGTHRSEERIPSLPKSKTTSTFSPPSQRNGPTNDAMNKSATVSSAPSGVSHSQWANDSNISIGTADFTHPMENGQRKLSVASVDHQQQAAQESQAPEHEGWLHKQSDKYKTWNKRWFVLKGTNLFYFKSPKDVRMKGIINLRGYRIIVDDSIHSGKYCFKAQHEHERTFFFYTDTEDSMRKWINVLMKTTIARDISTPVMSSNPVATVSLEVARKMRPRPPSMIMYKGQQQQRPATNLAVPSESLSMLQEEVDDEQQVSNSANAYTDDSSSYADVRPQNSSNAVWDRSDYVDWVNQHIETRRIDNLTTSFRDGQVLIELLENLSNKTVRRPLEPDNDDENAVNMHMLDTIVAAFKFMGREGVAIDGNFTIKDIFAGNEDKIIHMLDALRTWAEGTDVAMSRAKMTTSVF